LVEGEPLQARNPQTQGVILMNLRKMATAAAMLAAALGGGAAQARGDVHWSVTIASPEVRLPGGGVVYLPPIPLPRAVVVQPRHEVEYRDHPHRGVEYREPRRWDVDGDGIPNRYDRVYNPRWDRDGDGVPNRYDRTPRGGSDHRGWHDDRRGWQDDRRGWHDERRDHRRDHRGRHDD
jgi:hypothetical protein